MKLLRIIIDILLFLSIFLLPSYISFLFLIILLFIFSNFVEIFFLSFALDSLYSVKSLTLQGLPFFYDLFFNLVCLHRFLFVAFIVFMISLKLKNILKFYPKYRL